MKYRKSFPALKLILGSNEQALILTDLLEAYMYRLSKQWCDKNILTGVTTDGYIAKSRTLIMEDTGVLTATVKSTVNKLLEQGFIIKTRLKPIPGYIEPVLQYKLYLGTQLYLDKAEEYLKKYHRPDDKDTVRKMLIPFIENLKECDNIFDVLDLGDEYSKSQLEDTEWI